MTKQALDVQFEDMVSAGMPAIYLHSCESAEDVILQIHEVCDRRKWLLYVWCIENGLTRFAHNSDSGWKFVPIEYNKASGQLREAEKSNLMTFGAVMGVVDKLNKGHKVAGDEDANAILVLKNGHMFVQGPAITLFQNRASRAKQHRQHMVVLSTVVKVPEELQEQQLFQIIEHELPDRDEVWGIAESIAVENELPDDEDAQEALIDAAAGLTRNAAENAFSLAIVQKEKLQEDMLSPDPIWDLKRDALGLESNKALELYKGGETFDDIGGLDSMKEYCLSVLQERQSKPKFRPRGSLLMGVSGSGKSLFAKALGNEVGRPTIRFDIGATMGSLLGQSQSQFRRALRTADAMSPCILFIDELDKALAGVQSSARTDGGVKAEVFGYFLTWLQDHESDVYTICTVNDIREISSKHPEFLRRFDQLFMVDFPGREAKDQIWKIHLQSYELIDDESEFNATLLPDDTDWTGAEIETCCRKARLTKKTVHEIGSVMPKIVDQAGTTIQELRDWADGRCYDTEQEKVYQTGTSETVTVKAGTGGKRAGRSTNRRTTKKKGS